MSGFIAAVTKEKLIKDALLSSLKKLEYEGFDSAGVAIVSGGDIKIVRTVGSVCDLEKKIPNALNGTVGFGHTRWSTYTQQIVANVYPIQSNKKIITLISNGVVDNVLVIKKRLIDRGYKFSSKSAIEVIANLVEYNLLKYKDPLKALNRVITLLEGSYALVFLIEDQPGTLYFAKNKSTLILGKNHDGFYLGSDYICIAEEASGYYVVGDKEMGVVTSDECHIFDENLQIVETSFNNTKLEAESLELMGYPHFMLKEIEEAPRVIRRVLNNYFDGTKYLFDKATIDRINRAENIVFLAAGTSYNASLVGQRYLRNYNKTVDVYLANEWSFYPYRSDDDTLYILISQSGETRDLLNCVDVIEQYNSDILAITNTEVSTLYRKAEFKMLLYAGLEVSVASTKAYIAQLTLLSLLYARLVNKNTTISALNNVAKAIEEMIKVKDKIAAISERIYQSKDVYFLGRGFDYDVALEAQLKFKETTYIHAEAMAGGEMKHGPIALISPGTPVVVFVSDIVTADAMRTNVIELKERSAEVIVISTEPLQKPGDAFVVPTVKGYHSPILFAVFSQYLAYFTAVKLGHNVDKPRNLSKAVVEK